MSGLFGTLDVALKSLLTQQAALRTTTDNLGNISSEGYSRRRAVITEERPVYEGNILQGRGAVLTSVQSIRDRVLDLRISAEQQQQSASQSFINSLSSIETLFGSTKNDIGSMVQNFFNSLSQLSANPADTSLRQGVLTSAQNLARTFQDVAGTIQEQRRQIDQSVTQGVAEVNRLTEEIAAINQEVAARTTMGQEPGTLEDQRTNLISELSSKLDLYVTETPDGLTLTTVHGEPLVVAGRSYPIEANTFGLTGTQHVFAGALDITADLKGGELGGYIQARDQQLTSLGESLDQFAYSLAAAVNQVHKAGFDLAGNAGGELFDVGASPVGAASAISVMMRDPALIAASSDTAAGGNANLLSMIDLQNQGIIGGRTPGDAYSALVFQIGGAIASAKADHQAGEVVLNQLNDLRGSISGVSLDEESANLIRFQQAYQASARVIETINELLSTAVNLGRD